MCFFFSFDFLLSEILLILRRIQRYIMLSSCYSCQTLIKLDFSRQIFEKYNIYLFTANGLLPGGSGYFTSKQNILQHQIPWTSVQRELICFMQTDRRTDEYKLIVCFCNFMKAPDKHNNGTQTFCSKKKQA